MRVPLRWLREYVDWPWSSEELAHRLTMSGLKIEAVERPGELWGDVRIGQVTTIDLHPTSDKPLWVTHVHYGDGLVEVVTAAPNVHAGAKVPIVLEGGTIPYGPGGQPLVIRSRPMAGITSHGMLCSAQELGLGEDTGGILILPDDAPLGTPLADYLGEEVLDIETVSNRPDTLSMVGVAREVAALVPAELKSLDTSRLPDDVEHLDEESIGVEIEAPDLCSRYSALRVEGVTAIPSPEWLARRLDAAGLRPINLLVDLSNYVMLELGQPMHAFDAARLHAGTIVVRRARPGETIRTLDGIDRDLPADSLVIADGERPVALAGVMGGEESEITPETASLILEAANFNAPSVRRTAQQLNMRTDASSRFERGQPPEGTLPAIARYVQLLAEITGDPIRVARVTDAWPVQPETPHVSMPVRDLRRLLGIDVPQEEARRILQSLGFEVRLELDTLHAAVPPWRRVDIERSADLVEEIGRIVGFDAIPSTLPRRTLRPPAPSAGWYWEEQLRDRLLAHSLSEVVTHTLTSPSLMARLSLDSVPADDLWERLIPSPASVRAAGAEIRPLALSNPATTDRQVMRLIILPSLLDVASRNLKETDERLGFFEIARTFFSVKGDALACEPRTLSIALTGRREPRSWQDPTGQPWTFFDVKGVVEAVLQEMQIEGWRVEPLAHPALHPGRSAALLLGEMQVGFLGELHPGVAAQFEIENWPVQVAEIDLDELIARASAERHFSPLPRYPAAYRDIAIVVDRSTAADAIMRLVRKAGGDLLEMARIFDVYEGSPLASDQKSVAIEMSFRSAERTLTQDEVDAAVEAIVQELHQEMNAVLRE